MKGLLGWKFPVARKVGKAFGIGLTEDEKRARDMSFGDVTAQQQIDIATGALNPETGVYEQREPENPEAGRVASRHGAQAQGAGRSLNQMPGDVYEQEQIDAQNNTWSGKPASEWTNDEIMELQKNLNNAGYTDMDGNKLTVDGMLGRLSYTDFEGKELEDDGMLGPRTVSALRKAQGAFGRGDRAVEQTSPPFSGPAGDQSTAGVGVQDESTGGGVSSGARQAPTVARPTDPNTGEITEAYSPAPPATYEEPSVMGSAKRVGKSYWDYLSGKQGWVPDLWQK